MLFGCQSLVDAFGALTICETVLAKAKSSNGLTVSLNAAAKVTFTNHCFGNPN